MRHLQTFYFYLFLFILLMNEHLQAFARKKKKKRTPPPSVEWVDVFLGARKMARGRTALDAIPPLPQALRERAGAAVPMARSCVVVLTAKYRGHRHRTVPIRPAGKPSAQENRRYRKVCADGNRRHSFGRLHSLSAVMAR
jgi:hypothetical protein